MYSMDRTTKYCIYGVCGISDHSLFVDYLDHSIHTREADVLQQMAHCSNQALRAWQVSQAPRVSDVFEIEAVFSKEAAEEAVAFWRVYFRFLGGTVIDGMHVGTAIDTPSKWRPS
jgi:hypothetical protein